MLPVGERVAALLELKSVFEQQLKDRRAALKAEANILNIVLDNQGFKTLNRRNRNLDRASAVSRVEELLNIKVTD